MYVETLDDVYANAREWQECEDPGFSLKHQREWYDVEGILVPRRWLAIKNADPSKMRDDVDQRVLTGVLTPWFEVAPGRRAVHVGGSAASRVWVLRGQTSGNVVEAMFTLYKQMNLEDRAAFRKRITEDR